MNRYISSTKEKDLSLKTSLSEQPLICRAPSSPCSPRCVYQLFLQLCRLHATERAEVETFTQVGLEAIHPARLHTMHKSQEKGLWGLVIVLG